MARERRFSAQASHELRTPLTVLRGELEELVTRSTENKESAERALDSADKLVELVEALLLFGRAEARFHTGDLELLNLADIVRDELDRSAKSNNLRGHFITDLPDEVLVLGNEQLLGRAVSNLLDNAAKYGAPGTPAEISVQVREGAAFLTVRDHGVGVPQEYRQRIFEPFFRDPRARSSRPGHGLGLTLARAVAHAHGGDLRFSPGSTEGSVFELQIPTFRHVTAG